MLEKENKRLKENEKENKRGRRMVEMLGVLAIMGVLAIGGMAGYRYAMDKYNANEILSEVRKRAITVSQQRVFGQPINLSEYGVNTVQGYAIETADNYNGNATHFTITVKGIERDICNQVIDSPLPMVIEELVGGIVVTDDVDCTAETNDVLFAFANDLASGSVGGGEGNTPEEFDPTAPKNNMFCTSDGECYSCDYDKYPYFWMSDLDDSACQAMCPNREIFIDPKGYKLCSPLCENGFRDYTGRCYPCDTPKEISNVSKDECNKCKGAWYQKIRDWHSSGFCTLKSVCENGLQDYDGRCYPCDTPKGIIASEAECNKCKDASGQKIREQDRWGSCILRECEGFRDFRGSCHPCDTPKGIDTSEAECNKCKDASGQTIRDWHSSGFCNLKSVCDSGFRGYDGRCYPCDTPEGIDVGRSGLCEEKCPNRVKNKDYCSLKDCDGFQISSSGSCYPCDTPRAMKVGSSGTCEEKCPNRVKNGDCCNLKSVCDNGVQDYDGECYPCDTPRPISVGRDGVCSEACTGADKRFKRYGWTGSCYCNLCPKNVASPALNTQEMCEACGGQWNGSVCCDGDRCATDIISYLR